MLELKQLYEDRADLAKEIRKLADRRQSGEKWTSEDSRQFREAQQDYKELTERIESEEFALEVERGQRATRGGDIGRGHGGDIARKDNEEEARLLGRSTAADRPPIVRPGECRALRRGESCVSFVSQRDVLPPEARFDGLTPGAMVRAFLRGPRTDLEKRALAEGTDSAGGFTVPEVLSARIIDRLRERSHVLSLGGQVVPLDSDNHRFVRIATDPAAGWRAENAVVAESDPTFGALVFTPRTLAVVVRASRELVEDSENVEQALEMALSRSMATELDRVALVGTGTPPEPQGLRTATGVNEVVMGAADGAAITNYVPFLDAIELMRSDNARDPSGIIHAPRTQRVIDGFADTTGQPLMPPRTLADVPFRSTTSVPIDETQGTSSDASTSFLGDWPELWLGIRTQSGPQREIRRQPPVRFLGVPPRRCRFCAPRELRPHHRHHPLAFFSYFSIGWRAGGVFPLSMGFLCAVGSPSFGGGPPTSSF